MPGEELNHLITMINQIAANIAIGESDAVLAPKIADHIQRFWAPRMKQQIIQYANEDGTGLDSAALAAIAVLNTPS